MVIFTVFSNNKPLQQRVGMFKSFIFFFLLSILSLHAEIDSEKLDKLNVEALLVKNLKNNEILYSKEEIGRASCRERV